MTLSQNRNNLKGITDKINQHTPKIKILKINTGGSLLRNFQCPYKRNILEKDQFM